MADPKEQEIQRELFEEFSSQESRRAERIPPLARAQKPILFSTTLEHLLLGGILLILAFCFIFFLGVLRGKSLSVSLPASVPRPMQKIQPPPVPRVTPGAPAAAMMPSPEANVPPAAAQNSTVKAYTIQLVTHKKKDIAESEAAALKRGGVYSFILTSGEYYLVCAGQYASKEEAKKDLRFFSAKYKDCFLRRR